MKFGRNVPLLNSHRLTESDFRYDVISRRLVLQRYVTTYLVLAVVFCWNDLFKKPMGDTHSRIEETCTRNLHHQGSATEGVAGPRLWNSLPVELRQQDICLTEFRRLLKTFLFR